MPLLDEAKAALCKHYPSGRVQLETLLTLLDEIDAAARADEAKQAADRALAHCAALTNPMRAKKLARKVA